MKSLVVAFAALLFCLIAATKGNKNLFKFQVDESDDNDEYLVTFSYASSASGHGKLRRTTDSSKVVFGVEMAAKIYDVDLNADASLELVPAHSGYSVKTAAQIGTIAGFTATYLMQAQRLYDCPRLVLRHNLTTVPDDLFYFSSGLQETCGEGNDSRLTIDVDLRSSLSPLLTTHLEQLFVFAENSGWESMNATNTAMDIAVGAEWSGGQSLYHHKKTCKFEKKITDWPIPSFTLIYEHAPDSIVLSILKHLSQPHDEL